MTQKKKKNGGEREWLNLKPLLGTGKYVARKMAELGKETVLTMELGKETVLTIDRNHSWISLYVSPCHFQPTVISEWGLEAPVQGSVKQTPLWMLDLGSDSIHKCFDYQSYLEGMLTICRPT